MQQEQLIEFTPSQAETDRVLRRARQERAAPKPRSGLLARLLWRPAQFIALAIAITAGSIAASQLSQAPAVVVGGGVLAALLAACGWHLWLSPQLRRLLGRPIAEDPPQRPARLILSEDGLCVEDGLTSVFMKWAAIEKVSVDPGALVVEGTPQAYFFVVPQSAFPTAEAMRTLADRLSAALAERRTSPL